MEYLKFRSGKQIIKFPFKLDNLSNLKWLKLVNFEIDQQLIEGIKSEKMCSLKFKDCRLKDKILIENITSLRVLELYNCYNFDENSELGFNENGNEKIEYLCIKNFNLNENISIFKLRNLKYLNLQANDIELSFELFNDLSNLEELRIDINKETEFSSLHSSGNNNLDNIYLQKLTRLKLNCKIERLNILPTDLFTDLKHLKSLKLSLIRTIQSLPNRVFSPLVCLEDLVINY